MENAPEQQIKPSSAEGLQTPLDGFISTQVFINKKNKKQRFYYAATMVHSQGYWVIDQYDYIVNDPGSLKKSRLNVDFEGENVAKLILSLIHIEKRVQNEDGHQPVPGLKSNYAEAANQLGAYITNKGEYIALEKNEPLTHNTTLGKKALATIYNRSASEDIRTWDDYYSKIVNKYANDATDAAHPGTAVAAAYAENMLAGLRGVEQLITDTTTSPASRAIRQPLVGPRFLENALHRAPFKGNAFSSDPEYVEGDYYDAARLTTLLRIGGRVYQEFTTAPAEAFTDTVRLLGKIRDAITAFAEIRMRFSVEQAAQLANLITQGPDPYAEKPLPLERFVLQFKKNAIPPKPPQAG